MLKYAFIEFLYKIYLNQNATKEFIWTILFSFYLIEKLYKTLCHIQVKVKVEAFNLPFQAPVSLCTNLTTTSHFNNRGHVVMPHSNN